MVEVVEIDAQILRALIIDARTKLNDNPRTCGVSSNAIFKRAKRLKETGIIKRAMLFTNFTGLGYRHPATIRISLTLGQEQRVIGLLQKRGDLNLAALPKSAYELNDLKEAVTKEQGAKRVSVNFWSKPHFNFENVDLNPKGA
jgi:DNA-binding Lrp family transcriptional regulator